MTGPAYRSRSRLFWTGFLVVTLIIAGAASYLASPDPDGLDATTRIGCQVTGNAGAEELTGHCIARSATEHPLADAPLADYALAGASGTVGPAGVIGVLVTLVVAGSAFRMIARSKSRRDVGDTLGD